LPGLELRPEVIHEFITQAAVHETAWLEFFREAAVQPYVVVYEDLVNAYEMTAKDILHYLGIAYPEPLAFEPRRIKRQADALSDEWVQRVLAMYRHTERM
jgi:LPS sulfotransferase NodH